MALWQTIPTGSARNWIGHITVYSARVMQEWCVLYIIDETQHRVTIRDIGHRRDTYRAH
jgi:mRNA-degrading endonuclease RelE of RelBE toxin-antitoxin system